MLRSLLGTFAEFERDRITERAVDGLRAVTARGYWPGGPAPYGYRIVPADDGTKHKVLAIDPSEAEILRTVMNLIVHEGHSTYSAATHLNELGIRTRRGALWRHPNLCHQLRRTHLTGTWTYNQGERPINVEIPALFSPSEWEQLQTAIKGRPRSQRKQRLYPLWGRGSVHLRCQCGANFSGVTRKERQRRSYYTCSSAHHSFGEHRCPHLPRTYRAIPLEDAVWQQIVVHGHVKVLAGGQEKSSRW